MKTSFLQRFVRFAWVGFLKLNDIIRFINIHTVKGKLIILIRREEQYPLKWAWAMGIGITLVLISCYIMFRLLVLATKEASEHFPFGSFFHFPCIVFLLHFTSAKIMCPSHDELMQYLSAPIDFEFLLLPSCLLEKLNQFSFDSCNF